MATKKKPKTKKTKKMTMKAAKKKKSATTKKAKAPAKKTTPKPNLAPAQQQAIKAALTNLIVEVLPRPAPLVVGNTTCFFIKSPGNEHVVCSVAVRKNAVGLQLPAGGSYVDPDGLLIGKGPAGKTLWLVDEKLPDGARALVEAALAWARR